MPEFEDAGARAGAGAENAAGSPLVGVILGFPERIADGLRAWRESFGDALAGVIPAHITLVTTTETDDWAATERHVRDVAARTRPFRVTLRGTGTFRPVSPVVYVNVAEGFDECVRLHRQLQQGPLERALQFPYHPHVTVAHDLPTEQLDAAQKALKSYSESFTVASMGLYEHDADGFWQLREELDFGTRSKGPAGNSASRESGEGQQATEPRR